MKKGRHRRYEEARALKRGSDLDIESIFSDLSEERASSDDVAGEDDRGPVDDVPGDEVPEDEVIEDEVIEDELEQR